MIGAPADQCPETSVTLTLTRRLSAAERRVFIPASEAYFAHAIATPRRVNDICLFVQLAPGAPFVIRERLPLRG